MAKRLHLQTEMCPREMRKTVIDANDPSVMTSNRNRIRAKFIDTDKSQLSAYAKDLEKTLQINKEILNEVIAGDTRMEAGCKKVISKLNEENVLLQSQVKRLIKERDEAQAKLLINEQMLTTKQEEAANECDEKIKVLEAEWEGKINELEEELDFKDYNIQSLQAKYNKVESVLLRLSINSKEIEEAYKELRSDPEPPRKMSNLVSENEALTREIEKLKKQLAETNKSPLSTTSARTSNGSPPKIPIPSLDLSKVKKPAPLNDSAYIHKLEESIKVLNVKIKTLEEDNRDLMQKNMQLENTNSNLFKLNMSLSQSLQEEKDRLKMLAGKNRGRTNTNRSVLTYRTITDPFEAKSTIKVPEEVPEKAIKVKEDVANGDQSFGQTN